MSRSAVDGFADLEHHFSPFSSNTEWKGVKLGRDVDLTSVDGIKVTAVSKGGRVERKWRPSGEMASSGPPILTTHVGRLWRTISRISPPIPNGWTPDLAET